MLCHNVRTIWYHGTNRTMVRTRVRTNGSIRVRTNQKVVT
jgi:hypothetical protein